ncbi:MAG: phosphoglycerate dehydrogenase, partial [Anaerolineae bacterium]|nr:phosphoglycerate dehydrogenase [Anaerolineae bacterium]
YTEETHFILGQEEFAKMKDRVYIVNCGRGGTVNEDALYDAIVSGKVAGAALDVFHDEKEDRGRRLMGLAQVIGSPHVGAGTMEASKRVGEEVAQIAIEFANR